MNDDQQQFQEFQKALDSLKKQKNTPEENQENTNDVEKISLQENAEDAVRHHMEEKYIEAVDKDFESRKKVRGKFLTFYMWFMSIVTILIFLRL